ncbi:Uncharacterised protein [uncultured archaeon]|nr:Uncharacterised protein [uncultured archaeon]
MVDFTFFILIIFAVLALLQGNLYIGIGLFVVAVLVTKDKLFIIVGLLAGAYFVASKYLNWDLPSWINLIILGIIMVLILRNMKEEPMPQQYY